VSTWLLRFRIALPSAAFTQRLSARAGKPGLRPSYYPSHYGAFVLDPDGYNIEAVCRHPA